MRKAVGPENSAVSDYGYSSGKLCGGTPPLKAIHCNILQNLIPVKFLRVLKVVVSQHWLAL